MAVSDFAESTSRIEAALTQQAAVLGALNQRINEGDANIEQRFAASEKRMADALAAMGNALQQMAAAQQQIEATIQATVAQAGAQQQVQ